MTWIRGSLEGPLRLPAPPIASLLLRAGLGLVFVDFGWQKLDSPEAWAMFLPPWLLQRVAETPGVQRLIEAQGTLELLLGVQLVLGLMTRRVAALTAGMLAMIVAVVGWTPIGVRDVGLLGAAISLTLVGPGSWSLDARLTTEARPRPFATGPWLAGVCVVLALIAMRPSELGQVQAAYRQSGPHAGFEPLPQSLDLDPGKVQLGQLLFHDSRLSGSSTISCATCHSADFFGADGRVVSLGSGGDLGRRNAPTVFNAAFNFRQFWDGRARTLEEQIDGPITNPQEMASSWPLVVQRLSQDARYRRMFGSLYLDGITPANVKDAIAEFERSLITPGAPFDRFLAGEDGALNPLAKRGFDSFRRLGCIACHHGRNLGGNSFQRVGKLADYFEPPDEAAAVDLGRFEITNNPRDRFVFRVPSLRNVARTAPYFHDGSVPTLEEAVRLMGRYQLGYDLDPSQIAELTAFLEALSGAPPRM